MPNDFATSNSAARDDLVRELLTTARAVSPSRVNAERLLAAYHTAYRSDDELFLRTVQAEPGQGVDGLTEPMTVEEFLRLLALPDAATVEIPRPGEPHVPPLAFTVLQYATADEHTARRFRDQFLRDDFAEENLRFVGPAERRQLDEALGRGRVVYLKEIVSGESSAATLALLAASYLGVVQRVLGPGGVTILGKCLEAVAVAGMRNDLGNQPVKRLASSLGLQRLASGFQQRPLRLSPRIALSVGERQPGEAIQAELEFGLYCGSDEAVRRMVAPWRERAGEADRVSRR